MKKIIFKILAHLNKLLLPSYTKQQLDLAKASKLQLAIIGWRYFVTKNVIN
ncbi:SsrA-binding protein [Tamlana sp. PT2-4]|uniref:SsrA-binding protein n=1 Tax=Neotamlana laminarinivorans TaxID=2883124 RepID=A0A9X1I1M5_9FLAO|nr:SsrA-binding protein [Tamlana laminarinivorans]MCB4800138.1 SsrA-binding protein [Tamlana laminarinivorans]